MRIKCFSLKRGARAWDTRRKIETFPHMQSFIAQLSKFQFEPANPKT